MQYNLGKYLRQRYSGFLSETYDENDIYVRSSDVDRTLMSAMSNLAGLYPPKGDQEWNPDLEWQPIPVHTMPQEEDNVISSHCKCPKYEQLKDNVFEDPRLKSIQSQNQWLFDYLTKHTGQNVTDLWDIDYLFDTLYIESVYNKTLPEWTKKVYPRSMQPLKDLSFKLSTWTPEMKRLRAGPLIQSLLDHFQGFIQSQHARKMLMYSGHDTTLSCLLNALEMFDPPIGPPYASLIMVELHKKRNEYFVQFSYRNETQRDPYELTLPGCSTLCPLEKFESLTRHLRPENWKEECGLELDATAQAITIFSIGVALFLSLVLVVSVMFAGVRKLCTPHQYTSKEYKYLSNY